MEALETGFGLFLPLLPWSRLASSQLPRELGLAEAPDAEVPATTSNRDVAQVSADLAYELQSKLFEQLATLGVAGAGLVITLRGSILSDASPVIWLGAIEFALAAMVALAAQINLIESLFALKSSHRRSQVMTIMAVLLIGMGIGTLGTSVFLEGEASHSPVNAPAKSEP